MVVVNKYAPTSRGHFLVPVTLDTFYKQISDPALVKTLKSDLHFKCMIVQFSYFTFLYTISYLVYSFKFSLILSNDEVQILSKCKSMLCSRHKWMFRFEWTLFPYMQEHTGLVPLQLSSGIPTINKQQTMYWWVFAVWLAS